MNQYVYLYCYMGEQFCGVMRPSVVQMSSLVGAGRPSEVSGESKGVPHSPQVFCGRAPHRALPPQNLPLHRRICRGRKKER